MSKIIYKNTEYGIGGSNSVELTQAQYDTLVEAGQVKENVTYYITDADDINASEIIYEDTTVENELDELNKKMMSNYSISLSSGQSVNIDIGDGASQSLLYTFGTNAEGNSMFLLRKTSTPTYYFCQMCNNTAPISITTDSVNNCWTITNNSSRTVILRITSFGYEIKSIEI